ncbi:MAG TPA: hypothetical protein DCZ11_05320 [Gammaproteobacteria bacterium]|nr:hypothetical protein [Gammaproteobacteria bacterium]MCH77842.1 hypothetical protein [Gammaproteobacteria bacterium]
MSRPLYYCASRVAVGDRVEILLDGCAYRGEVIGMDGRSRKVVVSYNNWQKPLPDGSATRSHRLVPIEDVRLMARTGERRHG